jgi:hypothetical protein
VVLKERIERPGIRPPKFADKFDQLDFESSPLPAISLFPKPAPIALADLTIDVCDLDCKPRTVRWPGLEHAVEDVSMEAPLICQIFNWAETVQWGGIRVSDFVAYAGLKLNEDEYMAFYSRDGSYFEGMPAKMALDPRVLLATEINDEPLPYDFGGPVRLVVPFLQGYKSVKWLGGIRVLKHDPVGIKRLLGQSKTGHLGLAWRQAYGIEQEAGAEKTPV